MVVDGVRRANPHAVLEATRKSASDEDGSEAAVLSDLIQVARDTLVHEADKQFKCQVAIAAEHRRRYDAQISEARSGPNVLQTRSTLFPMRASSASSSCRSIQPTENR